MSTLRAFHGDPRIKTKYLRRVRRHRELDQLIKGQYWEDGKGCAVGCTIHGDDYTWYETELGIPGAIAYLEDATFEALPNGCAKDWPVQFLEAIPVGADLSRVIPQFMVWLLTGEDIGLLRIADPRGQESLRAVGSLWQRRADGDEPTTREWDAACAAARDAAWGTMYTVRAAVLTAASAASISTSGPAVYAAVRSAASTWTAPWKKIAAKLLELLAAAPVSMREQDQEGGATT